MSKGLKQRLIEQAEAPAETDEALGREIDERKRTEEKLRESEERFRQLAESITEVFWMTNPDKSEILYISLGYEKIWGRSCESVYQQPTTWLDAIHPDDRERVRRSARSNQVSGCYDEEYRIVRPDGSIRWIRDRAFPVRDQLGQVYRLTGIAEDITERKRSDAALKEGEERLRMAIDASRLYTWDWDILTGQVVRTGHHMAVYGLDLPTADSDYASFLRIVHPDDREKVEQEGNRIFDEGAFYHFEFRIVRPDGDIRWLETEGLPYYDQSGKPIRAVGVTQDITERKRTEEALRTSEERFRRYFEFGLIGMAITSPAKGCIEVNNQLCTILGYERSELLQKSWMELTHPDDLKKDLAQFNRVLAGEIDGYSIDKRFIRKNGWVIHAIISVKCIRRPDHSVDYFLVLVQDVTERKQAEARLVYQANLLTHVGDAIIATDDRFLITAWNLAAEQIYGWRAEEVLGRPVPEVLRSEFTDAERSEAVRTVAEQGYIHSEVVQLHKDGRRISIQGYTIALRDEAGRVTGYVSANRDITERKKAEEALRTEHTFRKAIEEAMPAGVMAVNADGCQTYVNASFCQMVGWSAEELIGESPPFIFWPPEQIDQILRIFKEHIRGRTHPRPVELVFRRRNEERFPVSLLVSPLVDPQGEVVGYLASVHDISLLKASQEQLERRERQLSQAQRLAHLGSWSWDLLTDTVTWSDELYQICGVDPERFTPSYHALLHLIDPRDRKRVEQVLEQALQDHQPFNVIYRLVGMDGKARIHHASGVVSLNSSDHPIAMVGVVQDISHIKQAEETLRESEERYRSLVSNIPDAVWRVSEDGRPRFISQNIEKIVGYTAEEIYAAGLDLTLGRIHPDDRKRVRKAFKLLFSENQKFDVEYRVQKKDGGWVWVHDRAVMTYRKDEIRYADGVISDITERKETEEALRKSDDRFHLISRATNDAVWDWDLTTNTLWWNESFKTLFGYKAEEIEPGVESWSNRLHPDDKERVLLETMAAIEGGKKFWSSEYRFRRADGSYATIFDRGYVVHVENGKPVRMIGAMIDITARKEAEEAVARYAKRLRGLSSQLLEAQETERRRIARELHDEIGQSLTAVKIQLRAAQRNSGEGPSKLEETVRIVDQALSQVRSLSLDLHPPQLDELGLVSTLRWHLDHQARAAGLTPRFAADPLTRLHPDLEIACFRVAQEALTNVIRHAEARQVSIELRQEGANLHLTIKDDGQGFDPDAARDRAVQGVSMGLVGMQERAELAGGTLTLTSSPGRGTEIEAVFPITYRPIRTRSKRRKG